MQATKTIQIGDQTITLKELTVADIRAWLKQLEDSVQRPVDPVLVTLLPPGLSDDLALLTDLTAEAMEAMSPRELLQAFEAAKEFNRDFFSMRALLETAGRAAMQKSAPS